MGLLYNAEFLWVWLRDELKVNDPWVLAVAHATGMVGRPTTVLVVTVRYQSYTRNVNETFSHVWLTPMPVVRLERYDRHNQYSP